MVRKEPGCDRLSQQQLGVFFMKERLKPVQRCSAGKRVQHHGQNTSAHRQIHLTVDHGIEGLNEFDLLRKGFDDRQMADFRERQIRWYDRLHDAPVGFECTMGQCINKYTQSLDLLFQYISICYINQSSVLSEKEICFQIAQGVWKVSFLEALGDVSK